MTNTQTPQFSDDIYVDVIRPGVILSDEQWRATIAAACATYKLKQEDVLSTPYGYVTMPRPPVGNADGSGRVPSGVSVDVAVHPVFWLDSETRKQRQGEADDMFAVRLFLELLARKILNPETQEVLSPFAAQGIDDSHPEVEKDLQRYIDGQKVEWLNEFIIPAEEMHDRDAVISGADVLVKTHRRNYAKFKKQESARAEQALNSSRDRVRTSDFRQEAGALIEVGTHLLKTKEDAARAQIQNVTLTVVDRIRKLDECRATIALAVERAKGEEGSLINVHSQLQIQDGRRREAAELALAQVVASPSEDSLGNLWKTLMAMHRDIKTRGMDLDRQLEQTTSR